MKFNQVERDIKRVLFSTQGVWVPADTDVWKGLYRGLPSIKIVSDGYMAMLGGFSVGL